MRNHWIRHVPKIYILDSLSKSGQARTTFRKRYTTLPQGERNKDRETEIDQPARCKLISNNTDQSHDFTPVKRNGQQQIQENTWFRAH